MRHQVLHQLLLLLKDQNSNLIEITNDGYFNQLANYHCVEAYLADKNFTPNSIKISYNDIKRQILLFRLITDSVLAPVLLECEKKNIPVLPYKGSQFITLLYGEQPLRTFSDIDLIAAPGYAKDVVMTLFNHGFKLLRTSLESLKTDQELLDEYLAAQGMNEFVLQKQVGNQKISIDFHWGLHYGFLPYKIPLTNWFENTKPILIAGKSCKGPSIQTLFTMIIIHHGGRDAWLKLKFLLDLRQFLMLYGNDLDWDYTIAEMKTMKMKRIMFYGFALLERYLSYELPTKIKMAINDENLNEKTITRIYDYWANQYNILSLKGRLRYELILIEMQDKGFSTSNYFWNIFKTYSYVNPIEHKRFITFPPNYYILNGLSKVITYIYKRGFGKVIR